MPGRISFLRALLFILLCTLVVSGGAYGIWFYYRYNKQERLQNPEYHLTTILQAPREVFRPGYLEELFDLSTDRPTNCYAFDVDAARRKLIGLSVVRGAMVKVLPPHTVYVECTLRVPIAYLGNFTNTLIDSEGVTFPADPFFTPKRLPEFYLDLKDETCFARAVAVTEKLAGQGTRVKLVDLSQMNTACCGRREVVVIVEWESVNHLLRLDSDDWEDGIKRYQLLKHTLKGNFTVDLRLPRMAFLSPS